MVVTLACSLVLAQIRTGNTPKQIPGTSGWLPSGKGKEIPAPEIVEGKPVGMWWGIPEYHNAYKRIYKIVFFADGTMMQSPVLGGGRLANTQIKQPSPTWTFNVNPKPINGVTDGTYRSGKDERGAWFVYSGTEYRPCTEAEPDKLVGTWSISGSIDIRFAKSGKVTSTLRSGELTTCGTWTLDGYLLALDRGKDDYIVNTIFMIDDNTILFGEKKYFRTE